MIGGNLGDRLKLLQKAESLLESTCGTLVNASSIYESEAWGMNNQPSFLNRLLVMQTDLTPFQLLEKMLDIELQLERKRLEKWGPRTMDIDLLFYNDLVLETEKLTVPHPWIGSRRFVLEPLVEVAGELLHPIVKKTMKQLLESCKDPCQVRCWRER